MTIEIESMEMDEIVPVKLNQVGSDQCQIQVFVIKFEATELLTQVKHVMMETL